MDVDTMQIPDLTEATIRRHTEEGSYDRGRRYYEEGKVSQLEQQAGRRIEAQVQGSQLVPYTVRIRYDDSGVQEASCSCPYHGGSWCKHIAATLIALLNQDGDDVEQTVRARLSGLTRQQLVELIERLAVREPNIAAWIEEEAPRG